VRRTDEYRGTGYGLQVRFIGGVLGPGGCRVVFRFLGAGPDQGFPKDPGWAVPDAERVAEATLENVTP
jgi:hypothetical protein